MWKMTCVSTSRCSCNRQQIVLGSACLFFFLLFGVYVNYPLNGVEINMNEPRIKPFIQPLNSKESTVHQMKNVEALLKDIVKRINSTAQNNTNNVLKMGVSDITPKNNVESTSQIKDDLGFLVKTPSCKIPNLDPYDNSVKSHIGKGRIKTCDKGVPVTYRNGTNIFIDWKAVNASPLKGILKYCNVRSITRPVTSSTNHNSLSYGPPSEKFNVQIAVNDEYIQAKCYDKSGKEVFENFHSFEIKKRLVEERCEKLYEKRLKSSSTPEENLNVLFVGLDSVSRLNSVRFLRKTRNFLLNDLHSIEMLGHNILGDGTFENLVPLLSGKYVKELPWYEKHQTTFDRFSFIWNNFSENGYRTAFLEDLPHGALFDYIKPGFHNTPTDYYNRHFHLALHGKWYNDKNCFLNKLGTDFVLDYTHRLISMFKSKPYFAFSFLTQQTHDYLEQTATVDESHFNFLKKLKKENLLNNTILFYIADHGLRFGYIRTLYMGKMEERLPMTFVSLPEWFSRKYPNIVNNIKFNSRGLTTNFDIYETLLDIITFKRRRNPYTSKQRGYSIFRKIPRKRSCKDADISPHWCTCTQLESVNVSSQEVKSAASYLLSSINKKLSSVKNLCENLSLSEITASYRFIPDSSDLSKVLSSYQLTILVSPGGGLFEGTVVFNQNQNSHTVLGDISRVNSYGSQKRCDVYRKLEMFCYCK